MELLSICFYFISCGICFLGENSSAVASQYFPGGVFLILFQLLLLFYNSVYLCSVVCSFFESLWKPLVIFSVLPLGLLFSANSSALKPFFFFSLFLRAVGSYLHKTIAFIAHGGVSLSQKNALCVVASVIKVGKTKRRDGKVTWQIFWFFFGKNSTAQSKDVHSEDYFILIMKYCL